MRPQLIIAALLFCTAAYSQKNNPVKTRLSNLLYIGVDNPITIYKKTPDCMVSIKNGTLTALDTKSKDSATYTIRVDKSDSKPILTIKQGKETMTYAFRKWEIPNPDFVLRATGQYKPLTQNPIELSYFRKVLGFTLDLNHFDFEVAMKVTSFGLTIVKKTGQRMEHEGTDQNDLQKFAQSAEGGDIFIFHDIHILIGANDERLLEDKVYSVKQ
jgi:hypothetical protein